MEPMSQIVCLGTCVHKQLLLMTFFICLLAMNVNGQSVRISDIDLNLVDGAGVSDSQRSSGMRVAVSAKSASKKASVATQEWKSGKAALQEAIYKETARYKIDPDLVFALVWQESRWNLRAVSPKNARGPFQLMPGTAARYGVNNPHDPKQAAHGGVGYFVWLLDRFGGNVSLALSAYNAGEFVVDAYLSGKPIMLPGGKVINPRGIRTNGIPPYRETENYVRGIAERYRLIRAERQAASTIVR
jgi:soluble lytic murein transglycosylase-like protein